jgi:hypothetical protein
MPCLIRAKQFNNRRALKNQMPIYVLDLRIDTTSGRPKIDGIKSKSFPPLSSSRH